MQSNIRSTGAHLAYKSLPPLPNVDKYNRVVTRFAPNPDFVLHLGSIRAVILSHDYSRIYGGKFIVRFEDTDPRLKKSVIEYYDVIRKDILWLQCPWDEEYIQSDRVPIYYEYAERVLSHGDAYVCTCLPDDFRETIGAGRACPCRSKTPQSNLDDWTRMLSGKFKEGEAVVRVKTETSHPNPAVRDWPALRIIDPEKYPHPRVGSKYRVWPLYNFSAAIDDHLMDVTHIIRGKEHLTNALRQTYLYKHLGWTYPDAVQYGRFKTTDIKLSKSLMVKEVDEGLVDGYSDPRLPTLSALRRRGYTAGALRRIVYEVGPRPVDATLSWDNINAANRKEIDKVAHRYSFIPNPIPMVVSQVPGPFEAHLPLHPEKPELGKRTLKVEPKDGFARILLSSQDLELLQRTKVARLMELFNVEIQSAEREGIEATFHSQEYAKARELKAPLLNWLPEGQNTSCEAVMPDASRVRGFVETNIQRESVGSIVQMVRFGFGRIDSQKDDALVIYYAHR